MENWKKVCALDEIPFLGARVVNAKHGDIALFKNGEGRVFALADKCPHKGGPLSQGIVHGRSVTCPLHGMKIDLEEGMAIAPDEGCARRYPVKIESGLVYIELP